MCSVCNHDSVSWRRVKKNASAPHISTGVGAPSDMPWNDSEKDKFRFGPFTIYIDYYSAMGCRDRERFVMPELPAGTHPCVISQSAKQQVEQSVQFKAVSASLFYITVFPLSFEARCSQIRSKEYWQGFQTVSYMDAPLPACLNNPLWAALSPTLISPNNSLLNRLEYCKIQTCPSLLTKPYSFLLMFYVQFLISGKCI